ncbi:retrotransposon protein, putative, ty1-copia subclass [Tanacetum coccineum]
MVPTKKVDKTPYELWYGKVPNLSYLKVWDYEAFVKRDTPDKLQQRSAKCIFIGYPKETIDTSPSEITSELPMEVEGFEPPHEEEALVRRFVRTRRAPERLCLNVEAEEHSLGDLNEPANYKAAMLDSESNKWLDAINVEMQSMKDNQVWCLVDLPPDCRLVAKGFTQLYGVEYEETFSPVTDIRAIRILIAIVAAYMDKILRRFKMDTFKRGYIPMQERLDLNKTQGASTPGEVKRMQNVPYASANPREPHWTAVKTILKYLRNTKDMFLVYGGNPEAELRVDFYYDAGFKTHKDDTKSKKQRWKLNT